MPRTDWVDCSRWQGIISVTTFQAWKASGIVGVILKIGGGDDGRYEDRYFEVNRGSALAAGLLVHGYWFNGTTDPIADADFACSVFGRGFIWADVENEGSMPHWSDAWAAAFEARVEQNGSKTGTYMSQSVTFGDWPSIKHRPLWVADYGPDSVPDVGAWDAPVLWQWTSSGRLPGYSGSLDLNESQPGFAALINPTPIVPKKEYDEMAFLPITIQNHEGGPAVPGIAIFAEGYVEAITRQQWDAFGMAGAQQYYTIVPGHFAFFLDQAARVRAASGKTQAVHITADTLAAASVAESAKGVHETQRSLTDAVAQQFAVALGNEHGVQFSPESAK